MEMLISVNGTLSGSGAIFCGGVPNTVARSAAESASPVAGPRTTGAAILGASSATQGITAVAVMSDVATVHLNRRIAAPA